MELALEAGSTTKTSTSKINWNQVYYFTEVAAAGSIKVAAKNLNLSSSTLSAHIIQLEKDLNVVLFNRLHRRMALTPDGLRLFQQTKPMFENGARLLDFLSPESLGGYPVTIGMVPSFSLRMTYHFIKMYVDAYPAVDINARASSHEDLEKGLLEAQFDFGFSDMPSTREDICSFELSSSQIGFFVAPRHAKKSFEELFSKLPMLIYASKGTISEEMEKCLSAMNIDSRRIISSDYPGLLIDLCQFGKGIGVFSSEPFNYMQKGILTKLEVPPHIALPLARLYVHWHRSAENSKAIRNLRLAFSMGSLATDFVE